MVMGSRADDTTHEPGEEAMRMSPGARWTGAATTWTGGAILVPEAPGVATGKGETRDGAWSAVTRAVGHLVHRSSRELDELLDSGK